MPKTNQWAAFTPRLKADAAKKPRRKSGTSAHNPEPAEEGDADNNNPEIQRTHFALCSVLRSDEWDKDTIEEINESTALARNIRMNRYFKITVQIQ